MGQCAEDYLVDRPTFTTWPTNRVRAVSRCDAKSVKRVIHVIIACRAIKRSQRYASHFFPGFAAVFAAGGTTGAGAGGLDAGTSDAAAERAETSAAVFPGLERGCAELTNASDFRTFTMQTRDADGRSALNRSSGFPSNVRFQRRPRRPR